MCELFLPALMRTVPRRLGGWKEGLAFGDNVIYFKICDDDMFFDIKSLFFPGEAVVSSGWVRMVECVPHQDNGFIQSSTLDPAEELWDNMLSIIAGGLTRFLIIYRMFNAASGLSFHKELMPQP